MPRTPQHPTPPPAGFLWSDGTARYLGITLSTLYKWRQKDHGPKGVANGRKLMYRIADCDAYLNGLYEAATAPNPEMRRPEPRVGRQRRYSAAA